MLAFQNGSNAFDQYYWTQNQATPGSWQLLTAVYNQGSPTTAQSLCYIYANGVEVRPSAPMNLGGANGVIPLPTAAVGQALELAGGDNEWTGGLNDLGMWNVQLTGGTTMGTGGGEIAALYHTPTSGYAALSQYGVTTMDRLFTLYNAANTATTATISAGSSTLTWQYVANGLTAGSAAGQLGTGQYFVQLDSSGGGVETVVPEPSMLALLASGVIGLLACAWRRR